MKKYLTLAALICSYLAFPSISKAQEKPVTAQKPILISPASLVVEPTIAVDKPAKIAPVAGTPDGNPAVLPVGGSKAPKPAITVAAPMSATGLKITPAPVNMDKPRRSTIKQPVN